MRSSARVLFLVENNGFPFDVRVRREAFALKDAGYEVSIIAPRSPGQPWQETLDGVAVYRFPAPPGGEGLLSYAFEFGYATFAMFLLSCWVALRKGFDVVHAANPPDTLFLIGAFFKMFGKKFVFDHHDLSPETYLSRFKEPKPNFVYRMLRLLEAGTYRTADIVIATNESYRKAAMTRGKMPAASVFVVRNGPPLAFQAVPPDPQLQNRARHLVGYIGTMGPQDGVDYWLRSVREITVTMGRKDFLAVIVGSGDAAPSLHRLVKTLGIGAHVWFTGRIPDLEARTILSTVAVCVQPDPMNPLNDKSTMNKVMEYMALGKPLVAFDLVETRYSAGEAALYAAANDEADFARKVCWLLDNPNEGARLGALGRARVESSLAWERSVPELVRAYTAGLDQHPREAQVSTGSALDQPNKG